MKRFLQVFRDGKTLESSLTIPLAEGLQGNMQTLEWMIRIVNEDRVMPDLRRFVSRELLGGIKGHDALGEITRIFEFGRDTIVYRKDPWGVERVADIWSTLYALNPGYPEGDCGIKSVFVATGCALLGHKPRFVVLKQTPNQETFNHIYVAVLYKGDWCYLDPTPPDAPIDWQAKGFERYHVEIFE